MGTFFRSIPQKLAIPLAALIWIGWLLIVIGFSRARNIPISLTAIRWLLFVSTNGIGMRPDFQEDISLDGVDARVQPEIYPLWIVSVSGSFVILAALAHAALWKPFSSIVGAITSLIGVFFITALGMLLFIFGTILRIDSVTSISDTDLDSILSILDLDTSLSDLGEDRIFSEIGIDSVLDIDSTSSALIFAGAVIATLFWFSMLAFITTQSAETKDGCTGDFLALLTMMWPFYDNFSMSTPKVTELFRGRARKSALLFIALTATGWLLVVIGFGIGTNTDIVNDQIRDSPISYPYWIVCFSGPLILVAAVLHAALWKPLSPIMGAVTTFLSVFFLTGLGMILYLNGNANRTERGPSYFELEFSGAIIATFNWTIVMLLWHFYKEHNHEE